MYALLESSTKLMPKGFWNALMSLSMFKSTSIPSKFSTVIWVSTFVFGTLCAQEQNEQIATVANIMAVAIVAVEIVTNLDMWEIPLVIGVSSLLFPVYPIVL